MENSKKVILAALVAAPLLGAASGQSLVSSAQADTVDVSQSHITVDHLGRPSVNGVLSQTVVKDSSGESVSNVGDYLDELFSVNFGCVVHQE